jgi:hypothetical protein
MNFATNMGDQKLKRGNNRVDISKDGGRENGGLESDHEKPGE